MAQLIECAACKRGANCLAWNSVSCNCQHYVSNSKNSTDSHRFLGKVVNKDVFSCASWLNRVPFCIESFHHTTFQKTDSSTRAPVVLEVVLFVTYAPFRVNLERIDGMFGYATVRIDMESKNDSSHEQPSIGIVGFWVRLGLEAFPLADFPDNFVKELRWENLESKVLCVPNGSTL